MSRKNGTTHKCLIPDCPNPVYRRPCEPNKKYCSRECVGLANGERAKALPKTKIELTCLHCKQQFYVSPSNSDQKCCTKKCTDSMRTGTTRKRGGVDRKCPQCGDTFYVHAKSKQKCCTKECSYLNRKGVPLKNIPKRIPKPKIPVSCLICGGPCKHRSDRKVKYCSPECSWEGTRKPKSVPSRKTEMGQAPYRKWRKAVLLRDGHVCVKCGSTEHLEVDHITPWNASVELRYELSNGQTLCNTCHKATDTYGSKAKNYTAAA